MYHRLATEIIKDFVAIDPETQPRNVAAWTPVVVDILQGCIGFEDAAVSSARLFVNGTHNVRQVPEGTRAWSLTVFAFRSVRHAHADILPSGDGSAAQGGRPGDEVGNQGLFVSRRCGKRPDERGSGRVVQRCAA
jgi:hypothetical protein